MRLDNKEDLTQQELMERLRYDEQTGLFYHRKRKSGVPDITKPAGNLDGGYIKIRLSGYGYRAHRLAWLYMNGEFPKGMLDHIDHNRSNNRIDNLRITDYTGNSRNSSKPSTNTSGVIGVHNSRDAWEVQISIEGKNKFLGRYNDFDEACGVRKQAEIDYGYHENHGI